MRRPSLRRKLLRPFVLTSAGFAISLSGCTSSTTPARLAPPESASVEVKEDPSAAPSKPKPIYDPGADARADIEAALVRARRDHKRVLINFGGNDCSGCYTLHEYLRDHPDIRWIVRDGYELVLVEVGTNQELLKEYNQGNEFYGVAGLAVLDSDGKALVMKSVGDLELAGCSDASKLLVFLNIWHAESVDAE